MALKREAAAAVAIPIVLAILFFAPAFVFDLLVAAVSLAALWEFYRLAEKTGHPVAKTVGMLGGLSCVPLAFLLRSPDVYIHDFYFVSGQAWIAAAILLAFLSAIAPLFAGVTPSAALGGAASTLFGVFLIALPATAMCSLRAFSPRAVLFLFLIVWGCDSFAYYTGKNFGRRKLAPVVSPNKTWEGTIGGFAGAALIGAAAGTWGVLPELGPWRGALAAGSGVLRGTDRGPRRVALEAGGRGQGLRRLPAGTRRVLRPDRLSPLRRPRAGRVRRAVVKPRRTTRAPARA